MEEIVTAQNHSHNHGSGILNVLLHGAFTFIHDEDTRQIRTFIPKLDEHAYRAGSWLAETELRGASYRLSGVKAGGALRFNRDRNLLVYYRHLPDSPAPYATLNFPETEQITSLRLAEVPRKFFSHSEDLVDRDKRQYVATLQVLSYEIEDENKLALKADTGEDHHWEPAFTGDHVNLHIFSSEEYHYKASNAREDFNACAELLGAKLQLDTRFLPAKGIVDADGPLPPGVSKEETEPLAARTLRLARLGRLVVQGGDANLAWYGNDALDGDPESCGSLGGCLKRT
jgi:hypothetical protein